ncbi:hypothetical protein DVH05_004935 [Phytophthora capsici]|nr:hypothetical protein DVH05_004935 [Phytophthora capsici]
MALKDGILRLELVMSIRFIRSSWDAKYVFDLGPVSVERIDILESKLRDYRDELEKLCGPPMFAKPGSYDKDIQFDRYLECCRG